MASPVLPHRVSVVAGGKVVPGWKSYSISTDMLQPADAFSLSCRFTREAWNILRPDTEVGVFIDNTRILTGYVGTREKAPGTMLNITGRDKSGRLVDESAQLLSYGGLWLKELAEEICGIGDANPLFERVTLRNIDNRALVQHVKHHKARVTLDPLVNPVVGAFRAGAGVVGVTVPEFDGGLSFDVDRTQDGQIDLDPIANPLAASARAAAQLVGVSLPEFKGGVKFPSGTRVPRPPTIVPGIFKGRAAPKKVQPGQSRWGVLEEFLREARLLAWSTADGKELFIGLPTYDQEISYLFYEAGYDSQERRRTNCRIRVTENVEEMYALYLACGASRGDGSNYGSNVTKNIGAAHDNPLHRDGVGIHFRRPKTLLISDDSIRSPRDATERAEREKLQREAGRLEVVIESAGHGQIYSVGGPTIYAVDTLAQVVDEDTGIDEPFLITAVDYHGDEDGTRTTMRAVPRGTLLSL